MPLILPTGTIVTPVVPTLDTILAGPRVTGYRFDLLDSDDNLIGTLDGVEGGSVDFSTYVAVKGGGTLNVTDRGDDVQWTHTRVRPVALLSGAAIGDEETEVSCGVFLPAAPVEDWSATGRRWTVELLDKNSVLEQDIVVDGLGNPVTFTAPLGANVLDTVVDLIEGAGEAAPAIGTSSKVLPNAMTWEVGTNRLKIINDLLDAGGFFSLLADGNGQYLAIPYVDPEDRPPVYSLLAPFTKGPTSLMSPNWKRDRDIYSIPNRYVCIGQGDGENEALVGYATNTDPNSPFSYQSRDNRWITRTETGVEAVSQADLTAKAQRGLTQASTVASAFTVAHVFLPEVQINRTVRLVNPDAGLDALAYITKTTIPFDPVAFVSTDMREAVV